MRWAWRIGESAAGWEQALGARGGRMQMIGCSALIAIVAFIVAVMLSIPAGGLDVGQRFGFAAMFGAAAFVASCALFARDRWRMVANRDAVRRRLSIRPDLGDEQFVRSFEPPDQALALDIRDRLARAFDVPGAKILPDESLTELSFDLFMPSIYLFIMGPLCERGDVSNLGQFPKRPLRSFQDLVREARMLKEESTGRPLV
jgi:hypothetical protein